jgi:pimeloyl-ACP methyl ester carboxylesterase
MRTLQGGMNNEELKVCGIRMTGETNSFHWEYTNRVSALVRKGVGGTLVIAPGAMADAADWLNVANALDTRLSVAIINRIGRAPSDAMPRGSTVQAEVQDVRDILAQLQPPFYLIGWSYGGLLALEASTGRTDISSIVLYEPVCAPFAVDAIDPIWQAVDRQNLDHAVELVLSKVGRAPQQDVNVLRNQPVWSKLKALVVPAAIELSAINNHRTDFAGFATIPVPVTVVIGERNQNLAPYGTTANHVVANLPRVKTMLLTGQGHLAHLEQPAQLAKVLLEAARTPD